MTPALQHRHFDYVLGPNQDSRLALVNPGDVIQEVLLDMDDDAPFLLTGRALRCDYSAANFTQGNLIGLHTRWTGPTRDYRMPFLLESLQMAYFGQFGLPKPIIPGIMYPSRSVLMLDLKHKGPNPITNLTFFFRGFKVYPAGAVPAYTYPRKFAAQTFSYPVFVSQLGVSETRQNQIFTCKGDADFVLRAGQGIQIFSNASRTLANVSIRLKDHAKNPYSSDFMPFDVLFGTGQFPGVIGIGPGPLTFIPPFGAGPANPGLFYPEIYLPENHQLLYDLQRSDGAVGLNQAEDFTFNFIGGKVFTR